jgi:uncharacterized membrane protein YgcG
MIIYDKVGLVNLYVQDQAKKAHDAGLITEPEEKNIEESYPTGFYTPNRVVRIGFFLLTLIGCIFTGLLLSLIFERTHMIDHPVWPFLLGLGTYGATEFFVKENHLFRSGIDDALLWLTAALLTGSFVWAVSDSSNQYLFTSGFILLLSSFFTLRFADRIMSVIATISFLALVFFCWSKAGVIGETTMPFVIMIFSYLIFSGATRAAKNSAYLNYQDCLSFVQLTSLLTLYAAGNYFVVQRLSNQLHHLPQENNTPLPFGWLFWAWTMLLPLLYIGLGIRNKSLLLLRLGSLLLVIAAYTFRNYYHLLPTEYALVISGTVLLLMAAWVIRCLRTPKHGFTYAQRNSRHWANNVNLESLIVAGATHTPSGPAPSTVRFGGGSFGGGGSSSDF